MECRRVALGNKHMYPFYPENMSPRRYNTDASGSWKDMVIARCCHTQRFIVLLRNSESTSSRSLASSKIYEI